MTQVYPSDLKIRILESYVYDRFTRNTKAVDVRIKSGTYAGLVGTVKHVRMVGEDMTLLVEMRTDGNLFFVRANENQVTEP